MTENRLEKNVLGDELRRFGENLAATLRITRSNPERFRFGEQIAAGMSELAGALGEDTSASSVSASAQRQELESQYLQEPKPASPEDVLFEKELTSAMRVINASLEEWIDRWTSKPSGKTEERFPAPAQRQEGHQDVHPDDVSSPPRETRHEEVHPDDVESGDTTVDLGK